MTSGVGPGRPPAASRFRKGESGNRKGRPRARFSVPSAFDIVMDRTLTVTQNGKPRKVTVEEALQHRTYQDAIAGNRAAQREVLKMIAGARSGWASKRPKQHQDLELLIELTILAMPMGRCSSSALLSGIRAGMIPTTGMSICSCSLGGPGRTEPTGRRRLSAQDVSEIKRCTREPDTLRWPARTQNEQDE